MIEPVFPINVSVGLLKLPRWKPHIDPRNFRYLDEDAAAERSHPDYGPKVAKALKDALETHGTTAMTSDKFKEWLTQL